MATAQERQFLALVQNAQKAVDSYELELASKFYARAVEMQPSHAGVLEASAEVQVELGNADAALKLFVRWCRCLASNQDAGLALS